MRKKSGYKFTNRRHPKRAIMSVILGSISLLSLIAVIYISYLNRGQGGGSVGMTGIFITLFSVIGLILGLATVTERDRYLVFPIIGIVFNVLALGGISLILYAGASLNY